MTARIGGRARGLAAVALGSALGVLAACGGDDERPSGRPAGPTVLTGVPGSPEYARGRDAFVASGCLACHRLGEQGNDGPGPDLSHVGVRMTRDELVRALVSPVAPMPSYSMLREDDPRAFRELVRYLESLE